MKKLRVGFLVDDLSPSSQVNKLIDKVGNKKATIIVNSLFETIDWDQIKIKNNSESIWYDYLIKYFIGLQSFNRGFASKKIILHFDYLIKLTKNVNWFNYKKIYNHEYL